jgi:hypothetical protein
VPGCLPFAPQRIQIRIVPPDPVYGFIMMFIEGTGGPNRFGPDPKHGSEARIFA